jgi:hypothetical protein
MINYLLDFFNGPPKTRPTIFSVFLFFAFVLDGHPGSGPDLNQKTVNLTPMSKPEAHMKHSTKRTGSRKKVLKKSCVITFCLWSGVTRVNVATSFITLIDSIITSVPDPDPNPHQYVMDPEH